MVVEKMPLAEEEVELKEAKEVKTTVSSFRWEAWWLTKSIGTNWDTDHIFQVEMPDEYDDDFCESSFFCWENGHLAKLLSDQLS